MPAARFCQQCGAAMELRRVGDRTRPVCPACGFVHYVNPVVAAGTLVEEAGRVLLVRRGVEPGLGQWGLPAGFAEAGESPEETARRETHEETGVQVELDGLLEVYAFAATETAPSGVLILYAAHVVAGEPRGGDDALEARFFGPDELPARIAFSTHRRVLESWAALRRVHCRPARADEATALQQMVAEESGPCREELPADLSEVLVADDGTRLIGYVSLSAAATPAEAGSWHLSQVYVRPAYRRWGIGSRLLQAAEGQARQAGALCLRTRVPADNPGLALFIRAGYRVYGFVDGTPADSSQALLLLCRDLATT